MDAIRFEAESTSTILRSTQIVEAEVQTSRTSEWTVSGRMRQRTLNLTLRLVEVFKGDPAPQPGTVLIVETVQYAPAIPRFFAVPGVWSAHQPEPAGRFVIFSAGAEQIRVDTSSAAIEDVRRAVRAGAPELSFGATMRASESDLQSWGLLFAQYLEARLPECFFERLGDFETALRILESERLSPVARDILMSAAYTKMMLYDPAPPVFIARLLGATARLLGTSHGAPQREAVLETYLPNLLGLDGGLDPKSAAEVLDAAAGGRAAIQSFLAGLRMEPILEWMRS